MSPLQQKFKRLIRASGLFDRALYARHSPDVVASGMDLIEHYIFAGEREGRRPMLYFDPNWYRQQLPGLSAENCLFVHYLTVGDSEGLQPYPGFDPIHVRSQLNLEKEPALIGFMRALGEGRRIDPNCLFDQGWYARANPDVEAAGVDLYLHFLSTGADEGRLPAENFSWTDMRDTYRLTGSNADIYRSIMRLLRVIEPDSAKLARPSIDILQDAIRSNHKAGNAFEGPSQPTRSRSRRQCDVFAFYLTQFHRVAENDIWWGEGFTEWHNVVRGVPRFEGHYQPRIPSTLGFYDLEDPKVMERQVQLARQAGLAGFAFYYYDFGARRLLEKPLDRFLGDPSLDCGFFLIWANETWSRRWDGSEAEILLEQTYPPDLPERLADDLVRHFDDPRHHRINGRPLMAIYRAGAIPDAKAWLAALRSAFRRRGENPLLYMCQTFEDLDPGVYGLDGAMEFPPHKYSRHMPLLKLDKLFGSNAGMKVWGYDDFVKAALADPPTRFPLIRSCFPSWDNDSRRQGASSVIHGSSPQAFRNWLEALVSRAEQSPDQPSLVCINAWNEWGEGAYLEPDRRFGHAYLNAVQAVLRPDAEAPSRRVLLVGHDAFPAGAQRLLLNLGRTLSADHGYTVAFLLGNIRPGYDGLLDPYRGIAETHGADPDLDAQIAGLVQRGFQHAIVNSSASASMLAALEHAGIQMIHLVHEMPHTFESLNAGPAMARAQDAVRAFVAPTPAIAAMLKAHGIGADRIATLPQGQYRKLSPIDRTAARAAMLAENELSIVVGLGYGDLRKGVDLFLDCCEAAQASGDPMLFIWQGDWDPEVRELLAPQAAALAAAGCFRHLSTAADIETLLGAADMFFLPSREDPLPSAAIEAWSAGLGVVAIRGSGGIADLIEDEPDLGTLADRTDASALLHAVRATLASGRSDSRAHFARTRFDWDKYVDALLALLSGDRTGSADVSPVDVAIVGHNQGRFAEQRIQSILQQTLKPRMICYHDVQSTDGSTELVRFHAAQAGIAMQEELGNQGRLYATWRAVAARSSAPYLHIAEGDDWIAPTMLERCVTALEAAPHAAYAFTAVAWVDEQDRLIQDHRDYPADVIGQDIAQGGEISAHRLVTSQFPVRNPVLTVSSVVWRRSVLLDLLGSHAADLAKLEFAFDWLLYLRAAMAGRGAVFVPELLCHHRQHEGSYAARSDIDRHIREIRKVYALVPQDGAEGARESYVSALAQSV